jgi:hypothetical protein
MESSATMQKPATPKFTGTDDVGDAFAIFYTRTGVKWLRGEDARPFLHEPSNPRSPAGGRVARDLSEAARGMNSAAGVVSAAASLVDSVAEVGMWWEGRQHRLMVSAQFEEERRTPWTADMMARWAKAHEAGDGLDLRISGYLARETAATLAALADNKKMALPQSMMYDLELIRHSVAAGRVLLKEQLEALDATTDYDVAELLRGVLPNARLNMDFVRRLGEDPAEEWSRRLSDKTSRDFDADLRELARHRQSFVEELFSSSPESNVADRSPSSILRRLGGRVAWIPELPKAWSENIRDLASKRDEFRELAMFSAEVMRATALHSAWGVVDSLVRDARGTGLLVTELHGKIALSAGEGGDGSLLPLGQRMIPQLEA